MLGYFLAFLAMSIGMATGMYLNRRMKEAKYRKTLASIPQEPPNAPPFSEQENQWLLDQINSHFKIWSGPGYWHKDIVIEFEKDHVRFSAIDAQLKDFFCGWNFAYSRSLAGFPGFNRFRREMAERALAMLQANYPVEARDLYLDGGTIILPTNGDFSR